MSTSCADIVTGLEPAEGRALCDAAAPRVDLNEENVGKGLAQLVLPGTALRPGAQHGTRADRQDAQHAQRDQDLSEAEDEGEGAHRQRS